MFIRAARDHYRFPVRPGFWDWVIQANAAGVVASIDKVRDELTAGTDALVGWVKALPPRFLVVTDDAVVAAAAGQVSLWATQQGYSPQAVDQFFRAADFWLVRHALASNATVVTHETSAPESRRRIKIPDVCIGVGVAWMSPFQLLQGEGARFKLDPLPPPAPPA